MRRGIGWRSRDDLRTAQRLRTSPRPPRISTHSSSSANRTIHRSLLPRQSETLHFGRDDVGVAGTGRIGCDREGTTGSGLREGTARPGATLRYGGNCSGGWHVSPAKETVDPASRRNPEVLVPGRGAVVGYSRRAPARARPGAGDYQGRGRARRRLARHGVERAEPAGSCRARDLGSGPGRHRSTRFCPQLSRAPDARSQQQSLFRRGRA